MLGTVLGGVGTGESSDVCKGQAQLSRGVTGLLPEGIMMLISARICMKTRQNKT